MKIPWRGRRKTVERLFDVLEGRLTHILNAIENQSSAANLRLDKVSAALDSLGVIAKSQMDAQSRQIDLLHRLASVLDRGAPAREVAASAESPAAEHRSILNDPKRR